MTNQNATTQMNTQEEQYAPTETVLMKQIYDRNTGRSIIVDGSGRRITPRRDMTGSQLVSINSLRKQLNRPYLSDHNVKQMSVDSASLMIDDLQFFVNRERMQRDTFYSMDARIKELEGILHELNSKIPNEVELAKKMQAQRIQNELNK
jgi:hypothetical protein